MGLQNRFKDIHKNKLAFILGCGVSIKDIDLKILFPYVTMAVGESILLLEPTYFFSCDGSVKSEGMLDKAINYESTTVVLAGEFEYSEPEYNGKTYYRIPRKLNKKDSNVITNTDDELIVGTNSAHVGINLLHVMGCNPIVLLGMNSKTINGYRNFYSMPEFYDKIPQKMKDTYGNTYEEFNTNLSKYLIDVHYEHYMNHLGINMWNKIKETSPNLPIINATPDSAITCFPTMSLEEVLDKFGDRR